MQICHESVKTVTGTLCSGTVVPYRRNSYHIVIFIILPTLSCGCLSYFYPFAGFTFFRQQIKELLFLLYHQLFYGVVMISTRLVFIRHRHFFYN